MEMFAFLRPTAVLPRPSRGTAGQYLLLPECQESFPDYIYFSQSFTRVDWDFRAIQQIAFQSKSKKYDSALVGYAIMDL